MSTYIKIMDSGTTGAEFLFNSNKHEKFKFKIVGNPLSNIKLFIQDNHTVDKDNTMRIKAMCLNWNGASVVIQFKTNHADDDYSNTGDVFTKDEVATVLF
jgi:hypothetical protein